MNEQVQTLMKTSKVAVSMFTRKQEMYLEADGYLSNKKKLFTQNAFMKLSIYDESSTNPKTEETYSFLTTENTDMETKNEIITEIDIEFGLESTILVSLTDVFLTDVSCELVKDSQKISGLYQLQFLSAPRYTCA